MTKVGEVFQALNSLKKELLRLRRIEQEYVLLKHKYNDLPQKSNPDVKGLTVKPEKGFFFYALI